MKENPMDQKEYIRRLLNAYRVTPGTSGRIRTADRRLAADLYDGQVPLFAVENAFVLATARRLLRPPDLPPLGPVRSLHYFKAVIDEVLALPVGQNYYSYLQNQIEKYMITQAKSVEL